MRTAGRFRSRRAVIVAAATAAVGLVAAVVGGLIGTRGAPAATGTEAGPGRPALQLTVSADSRAPSASVTSPRFTTTGPALVVAFVAFDGPSAAAGFQGATAVTGGGLPWRVAALANAKPGSAEVWQAVAPHGLTGVTVTAVPRFGGYAGSITVAAFAGRATVSRTVVASAAGQARLSVADPAEGTVWAVGNDWDGGIPRTTGPDQVLVHQDVDALSRNTFWVQRLTGGPPAGARAATVSDTDPVSDRWNLAAVDIVPGRSSPPTPAGGAGTELTVGPAQTLWADSVVPADEASADDHPVIVGLRFSVARVGLVSGLSFYKAAGNDGTHTGALWSDTGALLASGQFAEETSTGWQRLTFATPVAVTPGTTYVVGYLAPRGHYSYSSEYFATASVEQGDLVTAVDGGGGEAGGVFHYAADLTFPELSYHATNYWVEPVFEALIAHGPPSGPPSAGSVAPARPASGGSGPSGGSGAAAGSAAPTPRATGQFEIRGSRLVDPSGRPFVPIGANVNGPDSWWGDPTIGQSALARTWGFNTIRLNTCYRGGCPTAVTGGHYDDETNNDLAALVAEYTAKHIVVMIELQQFTGGDTLTAAQQSTLTAWWVDIARQYKSNPYVWFNILNEPTTDDNLTNWVNDYSPSIQAIRGTGARNVIVLDGSAYGQDIFDWTCTGLPYENSAIINKVPALEARYGNILPSVHVYSDWGGGSSKCSPAQLDQRLTRYIEKVHSLGLPIVIGETGDQPGGPGEDYGYAYGQWAGTQAAFDVAPAQGVGLLYWQASASLGWWTKPGGGWSAIDDPRHPTNLSHFGQLLWNYAHGRTPD